MSGTVTVMQPALHPLRRSAVRSRPHWYGFLSWA